MNARRLSFQARQPTTKATIGIVAAAAAAFVLTIAALKSTALSDGIMVIWPVEGVVLALMLGPLRRHPYLTMLVCKVSSIIAALVMGNPLELAGSMSLVTAVSSIAIFRVMLLFKAEERNFTESRFLIFFIFAAITSSIYAGLSESILVHLIRGKSLTQLMLTGAASNAVGYVVMTPLVSMLSRGFREPLQKSLGAKYFLVVAAYCVSVLLIFVQNRYAILYPIPLGLMLVA